MPEYKQIIVYRFGFDFFGILYCWKSKELFRMPYVCGKRCYSQRKLKLQHNGGSYGYWISGMFKSLSNLKEITKELNYSTEIFVNDGMPF